MMRRLCSLLGFLTRSDRHNSSGVLTVAELIVLQRQHLNDPFELVDGFLEGGDVCGEFVDASLGVVALIAECHQGGRGIRVRYPCSELCL